MKETTFYMTTAHPVTVIAFGAAVLVATVFILADLVRVRASLANERAETKRLMKAKLAAESATERARPSKFSPATKPKSPGIVPQYVPSTYRAGTQRVDWTVGITSGSEIQISLESADGSILRLWFNKSATRAFAHELLAAADRLDPPKPTKPPEAAS